MAILMEADGISGSVTHSGYGPASGQTFIASSLLIICWLVMKASALV